jgi:glucose/arabinose dehydrogenase
MNYLLLPFACVFILALVLLPEGRCDPIPGQVPISDEVPEATGWKKETVVSGLEHPWGMAWLPDGSILITERPGRIRRVVDGRLLEAPLENVPPVLSYGQGGMLDIALHPKFAHNQLVYFSYTSGTQNANKTTVSRGKLVENRLEKIETLYEASHAKSGGQHFGSRIVWVDDRSFLVSVGDGGNPPTKLEGELIRNYAQDKKASLGKVLRFLDDGTPHPDNPFVNEEGSLKEVYSLGHRNIQGMTVEPGTRRVWASEHGARGGDELNIIESGANYGWPVVTYSREYFGPQISEESSKPGMKDPMLVWTPSKAPSGLTFYNGSVFPEWKGNLFSGALKFVHVRRVVLDGTKVTHEDKLTIGERVRDVREGPDGYLYVLTDQVDGKLFRLRPLVSQSPDESHRSIKIP